MNPYVLFYQDYNKVCKVYSGCPTTFAFSIVNKPVRQAYDVTEVMACAKRFRLIPAKLKKADVPITFGITLRIELNEKFNPTNFHLYKVVGKA